MTRHAICALLAALLALGAVAPATAQPDAPTPAAPPRSEAAPPDLPPLGEAIADWQARWELARLLSYVQRYDESLAEYRTLLAQRPELDQARLEMAKVLFWAGRPDQARQVFEDLPATSMDRDAVLALADLYASDKQYGRAETLLRDLLKRSPDDDEAHYRLAEVLSWAGDYDASLDIYRDLLRTRPDDVQLRRKYAFVLIWSGQRDQAIMELRRSLGE